MTGSCYLPSLWDLWKKWEKNVNPFVSALSCSRLETLTRKRAIWTLKNFHVASYLDPVQRAKLLSHSIAN